mgnify:CR=1 FL=1
MNGKCRQSVKKKEMKKLTINQWAIEDRPREKMMLKGAEALAMQNCWQYLSVPETPKRAPLH